MHTHTHTNIEEGRKIIEISVCLSVHRFMFNFESSDGRLRWRKERKKNNKRL